MVAFLYWDHSLYEWLDKTKVRRASVRYVQTVSFATRLSFSRSQVGQIVCVFMRSVFGITTIEGLLARLRDWKLRKVASHQGLCF